jgi:hypothetical protein
MLTPLGQPTKVLLGEKREIPVHRVASEQFTNTKTPSWKISEGDDDTVAIFVADTGALSIAMLTINTLTQITIFDKLSGDISVDFCYLSIYFLPLWKQIYRKFIR